MIAGARLGLVCIAAAIGCATAARAPIDSAAAPQIAAAGAPVRLPSGDTVPLYDDLGSYTRRITTSSALAQRYFDQGMRLTYGFGHPEARRAFAAAIHADSTCAMCHWGLAWSLGPYINGPRIDSAASVAAHEAARTAVRLAAVNGTRAERALAAAMLTRYPAPGTPRTAVHDSAYATAMRDVAARHRDDPDAAGLLGEALMVLRPWDQWTRAGDPKPGTDEVIRVLEGALARNIRHPGACHHYIHATEASRDPARAEACADFLGAAIPGASHIPHMPSHTYMRVGRYGDAVRANQHARLADQRAGRGGAPGIYPAHNVHMLMSAAAFDGQSAIALQAARDLARMSPGAGFYPTLILARFGRWDELLEQPQVDGWSFAAGMSRFGRGLAHLASARPDTARALLAALARTIDSVPETARFRRHSQRTLLGMARAILAAEIAASAGHRDSAVALLEAALPLEDSLTYDEPEPWPIPVRDVLGAVLLDAGRYVDAETVYRDALRTRPRNGWSLTGLSRALRAQNRHQDAERIERERRDAWARADVWLDGSRFRPGGGATGAGAAHAH